MMLKKIICFVWVHKTVHKAYTGEKLSLIRRLGNTYEAALYRYERTGFCIRCGKKAGREE